MPRLTGERMNNMDDKKCSKCGCDFIITTLGGPRTICKCTDKKLYETFESLLTEDKEGECSDE